jgi:hypothetical protein
MIRAHWRQSVCWYCAPESRPVSFRTADSALALYFTAGPNDEANGLLGKITRVATDQRGNSE